MRIGFLACCVVLSATFFVGRTLAEEPVKALKPPEFFVRVVLTTDAEA